MFGRVKKVNNNYYISPHDEAYLKKQSVTANVIAGIALAMLIPALVLWIYPGIGSLLWLYELFEAQVAYSLVFICSVIGLIACFVLSFFGYKIRKKVKQQSAPTLGFRRSSYNGAFFTAVLLSALLLFQIVILIGYHVAVGTGYIADVIARNNLSGKTTDFDAVGVIEAILYALSAAASWAYYFFTFRVNRTMQLVMPDAKPAPDDAPAIPSKEDADKHRPQRSDDYVPPRPTYGLTDEEKELGKREFEDFDDSEK